MNAKPVIVNKCHYCQFTFLQKVRKRLMIEDFWLEWNDSFVYFRQIKEDNLARYSLESYFKKNQKVSCFTWTINLIYKYLRGEK